MLGIMIHYAVASMSEASAAEALHSLQLTLFSRNCGLKSNEQLLAGQELYALFVVATHAVCKWSNTLSFYAYLYS